MDRLYQERMARLVLDRLLESGELRSVASQRALSLRMHYLPPRVRLDLPAEPDFLPLLDPNRAERAAAGLRGAILRVVRHEESDHWVVVDPELDLDVRLREGSRRARVRPVYEPDLEPPAPDDPSLGEPRLRLSWGEDQELILRQGQGLVAVELGGRAPTLIVFEAPAGDGPVAWLYSSGPIERWTDAGRARHRSRTRLPVVRDLECTLRPSLAGRLRLQRSVDLAVEVLGLTRMGRPPLRVTSSAGVELTWDRNRDPELELGPDLVLHAEAGDHLRVSNHGDLSVTVRWHADAPLTVPPGAGVVVQGAHFGGLETPGGVTWRLALPEGVAAPPPRSFRIDGELLASPAGGAPRGSGAPLFRFEAVGADVWQQAVVLPRLDGPGAAVPVTAHEAVGHLADVALDDCPGVKVRAPGAAWRHVTGVAGLEPSGARLEAISTPQILFEVPRPLGALTTDPSDQLTLDGWRLGVAVDGLVIAGAGAHPIVVDGVSYEGPTRVPCRDEHRVRAGAGVYRIARRGV